MIGYVILAKTEWKGTRRSQVFETRKIAKDAIEKFPCFTKYGKPRIIRWIYEKPKPMSKEDKKWAEQFSKEMNGALKEVMSK